MRWQFYNLADNDLSAKKHVLENLSMGVGQGNALSTRLTAQFEGAAGSAVAIAFEALDLEKVDAFRWAGTYSNGLLLNDFLKPHSVPLTQFPIGGMGQYVEKYLQGSHRAVVVCENWSAKRSEMTKWPYVNQSRMIYFGEQVYHFLAHGDTDLDLIDSTIRESADHWGIGVCSLCKDIPHTEIQSEAFFDEIVTNAAHIFVPAFDGEGFLVWSPVMA
jgi:hypothetical protein